jgi:hypothetical protein
MQSAGIDRDAEAAVARYEKLGRDLALRLKTTADVTTVDGGNIAAALR